MANPYDQAIIEIAGIIRGASETGNWGDFEIGMPISDISKNFDTSITSDQMLEECVLELPLSGEELTQEEQEGLISCFIYCCKTISDLGIDPNDAVWRKYFINWDTYAIPLSLSEMEINMHSNLGGEYRDGIFDLIVKETRDSETILRHRKEAYKNAKRMVQESNFPGGVANIGVIQLVLKDWLMRMGKEFKLSNMKVSLLDEIAELSKAKKIIFGNKWERAYEACDVMIWIMQMFSIKEINMGTLLN